jgi:flagellar biosynthesis protein
VSGPDQDNKGGHDTVQKAVALHGSTEWDPERTKVVAVGRGAVAEQILQIAFANGVKVREDKDLVEVLEAVEIDSEIPVDAIAAVAEILSYLYRLNSFAAPRTEFDNDPKDSI